MKRIKSILKISVAAMLLVVLAGITGCREHHYRLSDHGRDRYPAYAHKQRQGDGKRHGYRRDSGRHGRDRTPRNDRSRHR